jgi:hypothetical protein
VWNVNFHRGNLQTDGKPAALCHLLEFGDKMPEVFLRVRMQVEDGSSPSPVPRKDSAIVYLKKTKIR